MPDQSNEHSKSRIPLPRWASKVLEAVHCPYCNRLLHRTDAVAVGMRWVQHYGVLFFVESECQCGKQTLTVMQSRPMNASSLARAMRQAAMAAGETGVAVPPHLKPISDDEVKEARVVLGLMQSNEEFLTATGMTPDEIQRYTQPEPKDEDPGEIGGAP